MKSTFALSWMILVGAVVGFAAAPRTFHEEQEAWRLDRRTSLIKPDGWLSLTGLHFLREGANRVGAGRDNDVVLATGPAHLGLATVAADGKVTFALANGVDGKIEGQTARTVEMVQAEGVATPTRIHFGTAHFFLLDRSGKKALRVKDSESPRRRNFVGLDYFPSDPKWRIEAKWEAFEKSRMVPIANTLGQLAPTLVAGQATFSWEGRQFTLVAIDEGREHPLFFVISDATSGRETYGASRFVYADWPQDGKVILDFNRAENPPCAFTPFSTCPIPPKENRLPFAVTAGEKSYRGAHD